MLLPSVTPFDFQFPLTKSPQIKICECNSLLTLKKPFTLHGNFKTPVNRKSRYYIICEKSKYSPLLQKIHRTTESQAGEGVGEERGGADKGR